MASPDLKVSLTHLRGPETPELTQDDIPVLRTICAPIRLLWRRSCPSRIGTISKITWFRIKVRHTPI